MNLRWNQSLFLGILSWDKNKRIELYETVDSLGMFCDITKERPLPEMELSFNTARPEHKKLKGFKIVFCEDGTITIAFPEKDKKAEPYYPLNKMKSLFSIYQKTLGAFSNMGLVYFDCDNNADKILKNQYMMLRSGLLRDGEHYIENGYCSERCKKAYNDAYKSYRKYSIDEDINELYNSIMQLPDNPHA